jgi:hypothetical protein
MLLRKRERASAFIFLSIRLKGIKMFSPPDFLAGLED